MRWFSAAILVGALLGLQAVPAAADEGWAIDAFDVRDRLATLEPSLLLLRGLDDPTNPPEYEKEIHDAVPGSRYVKLPGAGHFPPTEIPDEVNALIERFVATL